MLTADNLNRGGGANRCGLAQVLYAFDGVVPTSLPLFSFPLHGYHGKAQSLRYTPDSIGATFETETKTTPSLNII